jgi:hypothetical protein
MKHADGKKGSAFGMFIGKHKGKIHKNDCSEVRCKGMDRIGLPG